MVLESLKNKKYEKTPFNTAFFTVLNKCTNTD